MLRRHEMTDQEWEASVKTKSKTITGLPSHPFGVIRKSGVLSASGLRGVEEGRRIAPR